MDLESVIMSKLSQVKTNRYSMIVLYTELKKNTSEFIYKTDS